MTPTLKIICGDALAELNRLPCDSVHCVISSPPYWGLRRYLPDGHPDKEKEIGLEPTPDEWCAKLVEVFREVRRVLHPSGTLWLNCGDAYAGGGNGGGGSFAKDGIRCAEPGTDKNKAMRYGSRGVAEGLKPKDLIGLPWMLAFALRADGWWLRSEITWAKKSPMPESVQDRPTSATEKIFLLSKSARYFYDSEAVKEESVCDHPSGNGYARPQRLSYAGRGQAKGWTPEPGRDYESGQSRHGNALEAEAPRGSRNMRNFWLLGPEPNPEEHFAAFITEIPKRAILAGTSSRGVCQKCLEPWTRVIEEGKPDLAHQRACGGDANGNYFGKATKDYASAKAQEASATKARILQGMVEKKTVSWTAGCTCDAGDPVPATCLDPFAGTFTTCAVALELGRSSIGVELSPAYCELGRRRLARLTPGLTLA